MLIYENIMSGITTAISHGQLLPGTRLPSIREYASLHGVSLNSVKTAYRLLEDRGLIFARPKSGYFVCDKLPELSEKNEVSSINPVIQLTGMSNLLSLILEYQQHEDCTDLALACPTGDIFYPLNRLRKMTARMVRSSAAFRPVYTMSQGSLKLRMQIARRGLRLGMVQSADDITITHGTMEALNLAVRASTQPGDIVAVETPTFFNLYPMLEQLGRKIISLPTHPRRGMCLDTLETLFNQQNIKAVITIPSVHNPLGFSMPVESRKRLAALASARQFTVIEDAMYAELQFSEHPVPNIKAFDEDGWVMVCASYTKTIAPDFRIGWIDAGRFRNQVRQMKFNSSVAESSLLSETLGNFLETGSYELHLRHLRKIYARQIDAIRACIAASFPEGTRISRPQGGFILWIEMPQGIDALSLFYRALSENIICMPGLLCSGNPAFSHCLRLAVCFEITDRHRAAIRRLGELAIQLNTVNK
ncbi:aminotransferase-like domain-containing protein [Pectobacterium actinidiae]|uniref:aminotransferase-like domain-containing protein n=1 Tax=Pectobacterium actinidiae TaxID=1507808 RepID=UPI0040408C7B